MSKTQNLTQYQAGDRKLIESFKVTDTTAISEGYGYVYDRDTTVFNATATAVDGNRANAVQVASASAVRYFAGVSIEAKDADSSAFRNGLRLAMPGSTVMAYVGETSATLGDILTIDHGDTAGQFRAAGKRKGLGAGVLLQTISAAGLAPIALFDSGPDLGGCEIRLIPDNGAISGGLTPVGWSKVDCTGATADVTDTLADGVVDGEEKWYELVAAPAGAGQDLVITVTSGLSQAFAAITTITMTAANQVVGLRWSYDNWVVIYNNGATIA